MNVFSECVAKYANDPRTGFTLFKFPFINVTFSDANVHKQASAEVLQTC